MNRILCFFGFHRLASITFEGRIGIWCLCCNYQDCFIPELDPKPYPRVPYPIDLNAANEEELAEMFFK